MTCDDFILQTYERKLSHDVSIGNSSKLESRGHGCIELDVSVDGSKRKCKLSKVVHFISLRYHLLSVSAIC